MMSIFKTWSNFATEPFYRIQVKLIETVTISNNFVTIPVPSELSIELLQGLVQDY
jgi:hypothetical protein